MFCSLTDYPYFCGKKRNVMSVLDRLEATTEHASSILAADAGHAEKLDPRKYQFLLNVTFVPRASLATFDGIGNEKINDFADDLRALFDACLSEYEIFVRDMNFEFYWEYDYLSPKFPVIEHDNWQMLQTAGMDSFAFRRDAEVWLLGQFNMKPRARIVCRLFTGLCRLCRKYGLDPKTNYTGVRLRRQDITIRNKTMEELWDYMKTLDELNVRMTPDERTRIENLAACGINQIIVTYTFKTEIFNQWIDAQDFEYIFNNSVLATPAIAEKICYKMFDRDMSEQLEKYLQNRRKIEFCRCVPF